MSSCGNYNNLIGGGRRSTRRKSRSRRTVRRQRRSRRRSTRRKSRSRRTRRKSRSRRRSTRRKSRSRRTLRRRNELVGGEIAVTISMDDFLKMVKTGFPIEYDVVYPLTHIGNIKFVNRGDGTVLAYVSGIIGGSLKAEEGLIMKFDLQEEITVDNGRRVVQCYVNSTHSVQTNLGQTPYYRMIVDRGSKEVIGIAYGENNHFRSSFNSSHLSQKMQSHWVAVSPVKPGLQIDEITLDHLHDLMEEISENRGDYPKIVCEINNTNFGDSRAIVQFPGQEYAIVFGNILRPMLRLGIFKGDKLRFNAIDKGNIGELNGVKLHHFSISKIVQEYSQKYTASTMFDLFSWCLAAGYYLSSQYKSKEQKEMAVVGALTENTGFGAAAEAGILAANITGKPIGIKENSSERGQFTRELRRSEKGSS